MSCCSLSHAIVSIYVIKRFNLVCLLFMDKVQDITIFICKLGDYLQFAAFLCYNANFDHTALDVS